MREDDDAKSRFGHVRPLLNEALRETCPQGHRIFVVIAEPSGSMCVISDWGNEPQHQLLMLQLVTRQLEEQLARDPVTGPVH